MLELGALRRFRLRPVIRALHRDLGYLAIGLTLVYAGSGLAVNHIADWEPNFSQVRRSHQLTLPLPGTDGDLTRRVIADLEVERPLRETYRQSDHELELVFDRSTFRVDTATGIVTEETDEPRLFLRVANWLHLNRGKKAWTIVADTYALALIVLGCSGLFMLPGKRGVLGRGGLLALLGGMVPVLYVVLSGGP